MPQLADEPLYAVVDGRRVELAPMGVHEGWIASVLLWHLQTFAQPRRLGRAVMEILFDLATVGKEQRPDVAFVSSQRWPYDRVPPRGDNAWKVIPNLTVEVVSPSNMADEIQVKIHDYFQSGVELVWVIYPEHREVYVYGSPVRVQVRARTDVLEGGKVLPDFRLALEELFGNEG
ncbi:MAG TPA: Uma2 family endonuclease [Gemmataceae bacterium]|nr:Uma2 family endonuclease [Gemmataceae bacterium]